MKRIKRRRGQRKTVAKAAASVAVGILICLLSAVLQNPYYRYGGGGYQAVFWKMNSIVKKQQMQEAEQKRQMQAKIHLYGEDNRISLICSGAIAAGNSSNTESLASAESIQETEVSSTNVRTEGVEEGDTVKTDGKYIYAYKQTGEKAICCIYEVKQENTKEIASFSLEIEDNYTVEDMYLSDGKLIFVAEQFISIKEEEKIRDLYQKAGGDFRNFYGESWMEWDHWNNEHSRYYGIIQKEETDARYTRTQIYDVSDPYHPVVEKELFQDGSYEGSRMAGHDLYVISSRMMNLGAIKHQLEKTYIPQIGGECVPNDKVDVSKKGNRQFQILSSVDIVSGKYTDQRAVLGGNSQIYASRNATYLIDEFFPYDEYIFAGLLDKLAWREDRSFVVLADRFLKHFDYSCADFTCAYFRHLHLDDKINIIKYPYKNGKIGKKAEGEIMGYLDSDYALDEHNGYLRAVTTYYSSITEQDKNAVYILDQNLKVCGKLLDIAPEESVEAVRFMGDLAYFVTYEETDPVFTVDLSDPASPKMIGELKLPGFSAYMHPFGEHLMLGVGETEEGNLKLSLFNTADPMHVKEIHKKVLPHSDTWECEALDNPNAFFIDEKRQILGFSIYDARSHVAGYDIHDRPYWQTESQYQIYHIDEDAGITELCCAKQKSRENMRGLYIDNYFYIVNPGNAIKVYTYPEFRKCR